MCVIVSPVKRINKSVERFAAPDDEAVLFAARALEGARQDQKHELAHVRVMICNAIGGYARATNKPSFSHVVSNTLFLLTKVGHYASHAAFSAAVVRYITDVLRVDVYFNEGELSIEGYKENKQVNSLVEDVVRFLQRHKEAHAKHTAADTLYTVIEDKSWYDELLTYLYNSGWDFTLKDIDRFDACSFDTMPLIPITLSYFSNVYGNKRPDLVSVKPPTRRVVLSRPTLEKPR